MQLSCDVHFHVCVACATHVAPRRSKPQTDKQLPTKRARTEVCAGADTRGQGASVLSYVLVNLGCSCPAMCAFRLWLRAQHVSQQDAVNHRQTNNYTQSVPEQRFARGLQHGASQQHPPTWRRLTALASLCRSRKSREAVQPETSKPSR